jgi:hypothetical protein
VEGAVQHGLEDAVRYRKLPRHYGVQLGVPFIAGKHREETQYMRVWDNKIYSTDNINWFAKKVRKLSITLP